MRRRRRARRRSKKHNWEKYLELASEAASIAMTLRDKPTRLDWVALVLRGVSVGSRVHSERRAHMTEDPRDFFDHEGLNASWSTVPESLRNLVVHHVRNPEIVMSHWDESDESDRAVVGKLMNQELVGWVADSTGKLEEGPYVRVGREKETFDALGKCMWKAYGSRHLLLGKAGLNTDPGAHDTTLPAAQFREVFRRLGRFQKLGLQRSFLFVGPPGTGKSTGIRYVARELGVSSLRVELAALSRNFATYSMDDMIGSIDFLVRTLQPEVLIIDDIDRIEDEEDLLCFLELAGRTCRVVLASANCTDEMTGALLRPGRFDEVIEVNRPDPKLVADLVGNDEALAHRLGDLPIAYIVEFVKRRDALGLDHALSELKELNARRKRAEGSKTNWPT